MSAGREVVVHVDELVVDGAGALDRERLAAAVTAELGCLVGAGGVRPAAGAQATVDAGAIPSPLAGGSAGDFSGAVGRGVARALHGVLGGGR